MFPSKTEVTFSGKEEKRLELENHSKSWASTVLLVILAPYFLPGKVFAREAWRVFTDQSAIKSALNYMP